MDTRGPDNGRGHGLQLVTPKRLDLDDVVSNTKVQRALGEAAGIPGTRSGVTLHSPAVSVVLAIRELTFHQEVLDYLGRDERIEVSAAATDAVRLRALLAKADADVVLVCPEIGGELRHPSARPEGSTVLVVTPEMTVQVLRDAIDLGAEGVFAWPEERMELGAVIARVAHRREEEPAARGRVIAVYGARGGVGVTFVATHLCAALAERGVSSVLVDLDTSFADVTLALGLGPQDEPRTIGDLSPVADELSPDHVEDALYRHSRGFAALLAPADPSWAVSWPGLYSACVALLAGSCQIVLLHVPRTMDEIVRRAMDLADEVLLVTALDVWSLYGARRAVRGLGLEDGQSTLRVVVNQASRPQLSERDVERVLGMAPLATVRSDPAVKRALNRAELLPAHSRRAWRDIRKLAARLVAELPASAANERP